MPKRNRTAKQGEDQSALEELGRPPKARTHQRGHHYGCEDDFGHRLVARLIVFGQHHAFATMTASSFNFWISLLSFISLLLLGFWAMGLYESCRERGGRTRENERCWGFPRYRLAAIHQNCRLRESVENENGPAYCCHESHVRRGNCALQHPTIDMSITD